MPEWGNLGRRVGVNFVTGSHHEHTVASFVEVFQATASIVSGVAARFRSAMRRLGRLGESCSQVHERTTSSMHLPKDGSVLRVSDCIQIPISTSEYCDDQADFAVIGFKGFLTPSAISF